MVVEQDPGAGQQAAGDGDVVRALVAPDRLREFFAPRSSARLSVLTSTLTGFSGPLIPIHPRHETAFGRPVVRNLRDLAAEPPDLAFIMVPTQAVSTVIDDAAAAGVRNVVVLASGYREVGAGGHDLESKLVARAAAAGITMLGPNCLGFINVHTGAAPFGLTVPLPLTAGPVGVALQSGALTSVVL